MILTFIKEISTEKGSLGLTGRHDFLANFRRKFLTILSINSTCFKLEAQIKMSDQLLKQFKETSYSQVLFGTYSFAIRLRILIN